MGQWDTCKWVLENMKGGSKWPLESRSLVSGLCVEWHLGYRGSMKKGNFQRAVLFLSETLLCTLE